MSKQLDELFLREVVMGQPSFTPIQRQIGARLKQLESGRLVLQARHGDEDQAIRLENSLYLLNQCLNLDQTRMVDDLGRKQGIKGAVWIGQRIEDIPQAK